MALFVRMEREISAVRCLLQQLHEFCFQHAHSFLFRRTVFSDVPPFKDGFRSEHNVNVILSRFVEYLISVTVLSILGLVRYRNLLFSNALLTSKLILLAYLISVSFIAVLMVSLINPTLIARLFNVFKRIGWIDRLIKKITKIEDWDTRFLEWTEKLKESVQVLWKSGFMFFDFPLTFISLLVQSFVLYLAIWLTSGKIGFLDVTGLFYFLSLVVFYIPTPGASGGVEAVYQIVFSKILNSSEKHSPPFSSGGFLPIIFRYSSV